MMRGLALLFAASSLFGQGGVAEQYNATYSDRAEQVTFSHRPNAFLAEFVKSLKPGHALDVGMGQGRNAVYLAQQGWQATGFDLADAGVKLAREEAAKLGIKVNAQVADARTYDFGEAQWDLIVFCHVPFGGLAERVERGLKPGGIVLVEDFHRDTAKVRLLYGGFGDNELLETFRGLRVLHYEDTLGRQDWGASRCKSDSPAGGAKTEPGGKWMHLGIEAVRGRPDSLLGRNSHDLRTTVLDARRFLYTMTSHS